MKKTGLILVVSILVLGMVSTAMAGPFTWRENRQQGRINQGVRSGEVTPGEFRALEREQGRIEAHREKAWSDGRMGPWEAWYLTAEQNRASHHIWGAKHNMYHY